MSLALIILLSGCTRVKTAVQTTQNITHESGTNTGVPNVSQNETPSPWRNKNVFSESNKINVAAGQEFVIGYNWYNNMFPGFPTMFSSLGIVIILAQQATPPGQATAATGTYWFLLKPLRWVPRTLRCKKQHISTLEFRAKRLS